MSSNTKIILRIVVTLAIVGLIVLGVWLIWFKPTNELEVFNNLTRLQSQDQDNFEKSLSETKNRTYMGKSNGGRLNYTFAGGDAPASTRPVFVQIKYYRSYMFGGFENNDEAYAPYQDIFNKTTNKNVLGRVFSLYETYNTIDDAFEYYYSYSQLIEEISNKEVKNINSLISSLKSSYNIFNDTFEKKNEKTGEPEEGIVALETKSLTDFNQITIVSEIEALYEKLYNTFFDIIKKYNNLTIAVKDLVTEKVFENNLAYDKKTVTYEMALKSITELTAQKIELTFNDNDNTCTADENYISYLYDVAMINWANLSNSNKIYPKITISDAEVQAFAFINENYGEAFNGEKSVFKLTRYNKNQLANSKLDEDLTEIASQYNLTYVPQIQLILRTFYDLGNVPIDPVTSGGTSVVGG